MIVIPAGGKSARFKAAGIHQPKYMLPLLGTTVFDHVLDSFRKQAQTEDFLIVGAQGNRDQGFFEAACERNDIRSFEIIRHDQTDGMMPNVSAGLKATRFSLEQPLLIHVADVYRHAFTMPQPNEKTLTADFSYSGQRLMRGERPGLFETLVMGKGTGCYHVSRADDFLAAYERARSRPIRNFFGEKAMELSEGIGTLFHLRAAGYAFAARPVPDYQVVDCGTPQRYQACRRAEF